MLIVVFAFFIWVLTSFQVLIWGILALIGMLIGMLIRARRKQQTRAQVVKLLLKICGIFLACAVMVVSFWWRGNLPMQSDFFSFSFEILQAKSQQATGYIKVLGDYQVKEQTKPDRYIVQELPDGGNFLLRTEQALELGGIYHIGASAKSPDRKLTYGGRFFEGTGNLMQKMADFLSYEFSYEKWMLMKGYQGTLYPQFILEQ